MAVESKDGKKILVTPVSAEDLKDIHIGDIIYLSGDRRRQIRDGLCWTDHIHAYGEI